MATIIQHDFFVDITPGARPQIIYVSEYDIGRWFSVTLMEGDEVFTIPASTTATVEGTIADHGFTVEASVAGNKIYFQLTEDMTAVAGRAWTKIKLVNGGDPVSTCAFILAVDRAGVEAGTVIGASGFEQQIVDAVNDWLDEHPPSGGGGLTDDVKTALLDCFENVAWINEQGQTYYDALYAALYPPKTLVSISAAFNQGSAVIYDTDSFDSLKQYLTVTAYYDDSSSGVVTNYTLSGTLTEGTSTITVLYNGKTDTFNVTVSGPQYLTGYTTVGNPTIDSQYRMTTSDGNFIKTPFNFDNSGKSWELRGKVNVSDANQPMYETAWYDIANFVNTNNESVRGFLVELNRSGTVVSVSFVNRFNIFASSELASWNIVNPDSESIKITDLINGDLYFKAGWTGSAYYIAVSADGVTWSNELRHEWTGKTTSVMTGYPIAFGNKRNLAWGYCIYVNSLELDIDGSLYWKAVI